MKSWDSYDCIIFVFRETIYFKQNNTKKLDEMFHENLDSLEAYKKNAQYIFFYTLYILIC